MSPRRRSLKSLRRRRPSFTPRRSVLIVCEGGQTEPNYFKALRKELRLQRLVEVEVHGQECGSAPSSVVAHALEAKSARQREAARSSTLTEYDEIWCVCDVEAPTPHPTLKAALEKSSKHGLQMALSNPCFEYWYLLHFRKTSRLMQSCEECIRLLKPHLPGYAKGDEAT